MQEKLIELSGIDLVDFFGINDKKIEKIKSYFPKIKVIARGNQIKVIGDEIEVENFEQRLNLLVQHYNKFNKLNDEDIENILVNSIDDIVEKSKLVVDTRNAVKRVHIEDERVFKL